MQSLILLVLAVCMHLQTVTVKTEETVVTTSAYCNAQVLLSVCHRHKQTQPET